MLSGVGVRRVVLLRAMCWLIPVPRQNNAECACCSHLLMVQLLPECQLPISTAMLVMVPTTRAPATGVDGHALLDAIVLKLWGWRERQCDSPTGRSNGSIVWGMEFVVAPVWYAHREQRWYHLVWYWKINRWIIEWNMPNVPLKKWPQIYLKIEWKKLLQLLHNRVESALN